MIGETQARHQRVRAFVEEQYPDHRVTEIYEQAKTHYDHPLGSDEYLLDSLDQVFSVKTASQIALRPSIRCTIHLTTDGSLHVTSTDYTFGR